MQIFGKPDVIQESQTLFHLRKLAPGELRRPVALHHNSLVLHGNFDHHKVIQQLVLIGGVQPPLANLLVETRRGCKLTSTSAILLYFLTTTPISFKSDAPRADQ